MINVNSKDNKHVSTTLMVGICAILGSFSATIAMTYMVSKRRNMNHNQQNQQYLHEIIATRRTVSSFEPELPDTWETILKQAIAAAITAPNHKRTEPWRFYVPNRDTIVKICHLNASIVAEGNGGAKAGEAKLKKWLLVPGWIVVTCKKEKSNKVDDDDTIVDMIDPRSRAREDYAAVCCAIQNLCLSLHSSGYGTKWTTGKVNFDKRFDDLVGIPIDEYVVGTIFFGKPTKNKPCRRETKLSVDDVVKMESAKMS